MEPSTPYERRELLLDLLVARLVPFDRRVVHFIDDDDDLVHACRLDQHNMFPSLATLLETRLKLAFPRRDNKQRDVRLRSAGDHRRHERLVARRVEDGVSPRFGLKVRTADFDSFAFRSLLRRRVERPGEIPRLAACLLRLTLVFLHRALVDCPAQEENVPAHRALPSIDMSDKDDVQVFLDF